MKVLARMTRRRRTLTVGVAAFAMAASGAMVASQALTPPPAHLNGAAGLKEVGPIDEANGFPMWYKDTKNVKLELCLNPSDTNCIMGDVPDPSKPVSFPDNFPDEAFCSAPDASKALGWSTQAQVLVPVAGLLPYSG